MSTADPKYLAWSRWLRLALAAAGVETTADLHDRLVAAKISVHENMVRRWVDGQGRATGHRLEGLLDVLGVVDEVERRRARALAYMPPELVSP